MSVFSSVTLISPRYPASTVPGALTIVTPYLRPARTAGARTPRSRPAARWPPRSAPRPAGRAPDPRPRRRTGPLRRHRMGPRGHRQCRVEPLDQHGHGVAVRTRERPAACFPGVIHARDLTAGSAVTRADGRDSGRAARCPPGRGPAAGPQCLPGPGWPLRRRPAALCGRRPGTPRAVWGRRARTRTPPVPADDSSAPVTVT